MQKKTLVLFSGGLDTTLVLLKHLQEGRLVTPLFIDYGQWELKEEMASIRNLLRHVDVRFPSLMTPLQVTKLDLKGPPVGHASGRLMMSLGLAVMFADRSDIKYNSISTGYLSKGFSAWKESQEEFQDLMKASTKWLGYEYETPLLGYTKERVGQELLPFKIPWEMMYTCYWSPPCTGKSPDDKYLCGGCRSKVKAMKGAGVEDEYLLTHPNKSWRTE